MREFERLEETESKVDALAADRIDGSGGKVNLPGGSRRGYPPAEKVRSR